MASPYARKLAREAGVDVADATGSGPGGCACGLAPVFWEILCHGIKACVGRVRAASSVHVTWLGVFWVGIGIGIISSAWASPELC